MRYSTKIIYGLDAEYLASLNHERALIESKNGARKMIDHFTNVNKPISQWSSRRSELITYIKKAHKWCELKLKELE